MKYTISSKWIQSNSQRKKKRNIKCFWMEFKWNCQEMVCRLSKNTSTKFEEEQWIRIEIIEIIINLVIPRERIPTNWKKVKMFLLHLLCCLNLGGCVCVCVCTSAMRREKKSSRKPNIGAKMIVILWYQSTKCFG